MIEELLKKLDVKNDELLSLSDDLNISEKEVSNLKEQLHLAGKKNKETIELLEKKEIDLAKLKKMVFVFLCVFVIWFILSL